MNSRQSGDGDGSRAARPMGLDARILNSIRQMIRAVDIDSRKLAADHRITAPQLMALLAIVQSREAIPAVDVADRIHVSTSTLVGILDRLEEKGLIHRQRSVEDRREVLITATPAGRELASKTPFSLQYTLGRVLGQLSPREQEQAAAWMERLVDLMGVRDLDAGPMLEIATVGRRQTEGPKPPRKS